MKSLPLVATLLLLASPAEAQFAQFSQLSPGDARAEAMGGAFTAVAEGPFAVYWNPGGLSQEKRFLDVSPFSWRSFGDVSEAIDVAAYGGGITVGLDNVGFGVYVSRFTQDYDNPFSDRSEHYRETNLHLGAGVDFAGLVESIPDSWYLGFGGAMKLAEYDTEQEGSSAFDMDLSLLTSYRFPIDAGAPMIGKMAVGASVRNVFRSTLYEPRSPSQDEDSGKLPQAAHLGVALQLAAPSDSPFGTLFEATLSAEVEWIREASEYFSPVHSYGVETLLLELVAVRVGYVRRLDTGFWRHGFGLGGPLTWVRFDFTNLGWATADDPYQFTTAISTSF